MRPKETEQQKDDLRLWAKVLTGYLHEITQLQQALEEEKQRATENGRLAQQHYDARIKLEKEMPNLRLA